jgi:predicted RNA binding protein YcfA (HicA-like mRNA interferase family)
LSGGFPQVNGARVMRSLERAGFVLLRQVGSHAQMRHQTDLSRRVSVPVHKGVDLKPGTLRAILRAAQLTADELKTLL